MRHHLEMKLPRTVKRRNCWGQATTFTLKDRMIHKKDDEAVPYPSLHTHKHAYHKHPRDIQNRHIYSKHTNTHRCIEARLYSKAWLWSLSSPALILQESMITEGNRAFASNRQSFGHPLRTPCPWVHHHPHGPEEHRPSMSHEESNTPTWA